MAIHLTTLGGLRAHCDGKELDWLLGQRLRAALFVYLATERRVSRESLTTVFWPESNDENARHALRQSLYHLRKALGPQWLEAGPHELRIGAEVHVDVHAFLGALEHGDAESAIRLYAGAFLDGVNLVDLKPWESWVDARRLEYARGFRTACRELVEARRENGDLAGAIETARRWVAPDPLDDEAQHQLLALLAGAGERAEALRQYESFVRLLEPEGLRPLEETVELMERVRSGAAMGPAQAPASARWLSPGVLAVLPFAVRGGEDARYLGEGMVNLLGAALDGAGTVRPVDARAVFAAVAREGRRALDAENGGRLAARLGAAMFILGDLVQAGDRLHLEAAVYGADAGAEPLSRAVASGDLAEVFALVDTLAAHLLAGLGDPRADRLLRSAAVTTASLPAFKAFIEGERQMRAGHLERAAEAFQEAIAHDPSFAVAHYRLALACEWAPLPGMDQATREAARHADRLSPRDRGLLEAYQAWRAGNALEGERRYRAILARYPDDIEAWTQLGEILFHHGVLRGRPLEDSEEAWRQVLSFEPRNLFALPHLARIAAVHGRVDALDALLAPFTAEELRTDRRLLEIGLLRALAARDGAATDAIMEEVRRWEDFAVWRFAVWVMAFSPDPAAVRPVIEALIEDHRRPALRADLYWFLSLLHLANGQAEAAREVLSHAVAQESEAGSQRRQAFAQVTGWFAATLPLPCADPALEAVYHAAAGHDGVAGDRGFEYELGLGRPIQLEAVRRYTVGQLSLRLGESAAAARAAATLSRLATAEEANALTRDLDRGLRARIAASEERPQEALRLLSSLEFGDSQGDLAVVPFVSRAHERFLHAELLARLGRASEALSWFASIGFGSAPEVPLRAPCLLRQAELHERLGNPQEAARPYARFIELWRESDPPFQPLVDAARLRLAELTRTAGS